MSKDLEQRMLCQKPKDIAESVYMKGLVEGIEMPNEYLAAAAKYYANTAPDTSTDKGRKSIEISSRLYERAEDYDSAISVLENAWKAPPISIAGRIGALYCEKGEPQKSIDYFKKGEPRIGALKLEKLGLLNEAIDVYTTIGNYYFSDEDMENVLRMANNAGYTPKQKIDLFITRGDNE